MYTYNFNFDEKQFESQEKRLKRNLIIAMLIILFMLSLVILMILDNFIWKTSFVFIVSLIFTIVSMIGIYKKMIENFHLTF